MKFKQITRLFLLLTLVACGGNKGVKPKVQDIKELVFASGSLAWKNSYNLTAQTDGILNGLDFEVGDSFEKGQFVAQIDNPINTINTETTQEQLAISLQNLTPNSPALQQLQQNIQFAEAKYKQDKIQAERLERLYKSQSASKLDFENATLNAESSLTNLNALKKNYAQLQQQAQQNYIATKGQLKANEVVEKYNKLSVPQTGTVIQKLKSNGDYVRKGDVIAVLADPKLLEVVLNVDETSIGKIKLGQKVFVKLNTDISTIYEAKITEILAAFDEKSQSFICKAIFEEPLKMALYGTQLEANILTSEKKNALLIPRDLMDFGNRVNVKGKKESVTLKTGVISSEYVEVLEGISKEDVLLPLKR